MTAPLQRETMHASANETANGNSENIAVPGDGPGAFYLEVTAFGGTNPTLDVTIEALDPLTNQNFLLLTFSQKTGVSSERLTLPDNFDTLLRVRWIIGGTAGPNFTFSLSMVMKDRG